MSMHICIILIVNKTPPPITIMIMKNIYNLRLYLNNAYYIFIIIVVHNVNWSTFVKPCNCINSGVYGISVSNYTSSLYTYYKAVWLPYNYYNDR